MSTPDYSENEITKIMQCINRIEPFERRLRKRRCFTTHISGNLIPHDCSIGFINYAKLFFPSIPHTLMFTSVVKSIIEKKRFIGLECTPKHYVNKAWEVASVLDNIGLANHGESVLNVGGGATLINAYLASIGFRVTSIDTCERDERLSQYENITARRMGINLKSMQSNFLNASIVSSYDNVFSICVIEHLDSRSDQELFIRKMVSSLKPGGLFQLTFGYGPKATTNPYKSENDVKKFVYNNILDLEIIQPFKFSGLWTISEGHTWGIVAARKPL